ncbi:MAG: hypothetical protein IKF99_02125 [Oscillospiraceae bacterium]|nr:hypothetical protein [Oscillospiraceae bacterium]
MMLTIFVTDSELRTIETLANTEQGQALGGLMARAACAVDYVHKNDVEQAAKQAWAAECDATGEKFGPAWDALREADRQLEAARVAYVAAVEGGVLSDKY